MQYDYLELEEVLEAFGLAMGCSIHPFRDGNKRTAVAALRAFLFINGHTHVLGEDELFDLTVKVADSQYSVNGVEAILRSAIIPDDGM